MPNNDYANEPNQSRSEDIIQSILDNTEYDEPARSRIEYLLIALKNAIEGGGGGGGVTSYSPLTEKPKIDNHTLQAGNNTSSDLGLQTKIDPEHKLSADNVDDTNSTNKFNVKSDWNAASGATSEILNKPTLGTASDKNVPASGDAGVNDVVLGSDTRLTDSRNAKDVYNWAKQANKPTYSYSEITGTPTIPTKLSDLSDDATHRTVTDTEKTTWNGKQDALTFDDAPTNGSSNPVKSGGVYTALAGKQNSLSEAQMAAVNSGINSTKVAQIETNKNNILLLEKMNGAKNFINVNASSQTISTLTFTVNTNKTIVVNGTKPSPVVSIAISESIQLPAGDYVLLDGTGSSSDALNLTMVKGTSSWVGTTATGGKLEFTANGIDTYFCKIYVNQAVDNVLFKPMIITKSAYDAGFTNYQPYAMSNVELSTWEIYNCLSTTSTKIDTTNSSITVKVNRGIRRVVIIASIKNSSVLDTSDGAITIGSIGAIEGYASLYPPVNNARAYLITGSYTVELAKNATSDAITWTIRSGSVSANTTTNIVLEYTY